MFILGTPIPSRYLLETLKDWWRCSTLSTASIHQQAKFNFVYFSYQPDFPFLYLSLKSLLFQLPTSYIRHIHIFVDQKAPFSEDEIKQLSTLGDMLRFYPIQNFSWASTQASLAEFEAFSLVAAELADEDMLVKADSDILFISGNKLQKLLFSPYLCVGDGHYEEYGFAQGGLYMLRAGVVKRLLTQLTLAQLQQLEQTYHCAGEDRTISRLLQNAQCPFRFTRLMLFPSEYWGLTQLSRFNRWDFVAMHFVKDKQQMPHYYQRFELGPMVAPHC